MNIKSGNRSEFPKSSIQHYLQINGETGQETSYKQLLQEIVNIGSGLKKLGVKRGDVVALCSENKFEYLAAALAAVCCGATITPLNLQYTQSMNLFLTEYLVWIELKPIDYIPGANTLYIETFIETPLLLKSGQSTICFFRFNQLFEYLRSFFILRLASDTFYVEKIEDIRDWEE